MKRRITAVLAALAMTVCSVPMGELLPVLQETAAVIAHAKEKMPMSGTCGDNLTWSLDDEGTLTISGSGFMTDYEEGLSIFNGRKDIRNVNIEDGVTTIGNNAFYKCENLTTIIIPDSVTSIGEGAFYGCHMLLNVTIPDSVTSIGSYAFYWCINLTSITIPDSVTSLEASLFYCCSSLISVTIPDSVTSIGPGAFHSCRRLTSITVPDGVASIGNGAFLGCESLTSFTIPDGLTIIDNHAFNGCSNLNSITIPASVTSIGLKAFFLCNSLRNIYYAGTEEQWKAITIADDNRPLKSTLLTIHYNSTRSDTQLSDPSVPPAEGQCGDHLLYIIDDKGLLKITGTGDMWDFNNTKEGVGKGQKSPFTELGDKIKTVNIDENATSIGDQAFQNCKNIEMVQFGASSLVKRIGSKAFMSCAGLKSIVLPDKLESIGEIAFEKCEKLCYISFYSEEPLNSNYYIENGILFNKNKTSIVRFPPKFGTDSRYYSLSSTVKQIEAGAFSDCDCLDTLVIPNANVVIKSPAFQNTKLKLLMGQTDSQVQSEAKTANIPFATLNGFIPDKDGNSFNHHNKTEEDGFYRHETYAISNKDLFGNSPVKKIQMNGKWDGCCFGIAATMALQYNNNVDFLSLSKNSTKPLCYHDMEKPYTNDAWIDVITAYHLAQYTYKRENCIMKYPESPLTSSLVTLLLSRKTQLKKLVEKLQESKAAYVFSYSTLIPLNNPESVKLKINNS